MYSTQAHHRRNYEEMQEEASILQDQRYQLIHDIELSWPELASYEHRLEAFMDGLVLGGAAAAQVCFEVAVGGEPEDIHVALRLCARCDRWDWAETLFDACDWDHPELPVCGARALALEAPPHWLPRLKNRAQQQPALQAMVMRVLAWRRDQTADTWIANDTLRRESPGHWCWAQVRSRNKTTNPALWRFLMDGGDNSDLHTIWPPDLDIDPDDGLSRDACRRDASLALLRRHQISLRPLLRRTPRSWCAIQLAFCGNERDADALAAVIQSGEGDGHSLVALGLFGRPQHVSLLLPFLQSDAAEFAAFGLFALTGATLIDPVFVPEEVDEALLLEHESIDALTHKPSGEPAGEWIETLSRNEERWRTWWHGNQSRFQEGERYRLGQVYGPQALVACLSRSDSPNSLREWAVHECLIRYRVDVPFECDMTMAMQTQQIQAISQWAQTAGSTHPWAFGGADPSP